MSCGFPLNHATQIAFSPLVFVYLDNNDFPTFTGAAAAIMQRANANFGLLESFFEIGPPSQPIITVVTSTQGGGACNSGWESPILVSPGSTTADLSWTPMLFVAELVEEFSDAFDSRSGSQGGTLGLWNRGNSLGEGLSRALAFMMYRAVEQTHPSVVSAQTWLDNGRADWVTTNENTDTDAISFGCALLFLNFLRYELKFGWQQIIQTRGIPGGSNIFNRTLAAVYQELTGSTDAFSRFNNLLSVYYPPFDPSGATTNNPFPLARSGGLMVQGNFGGRGNFEVVVPAAGGGLVHIWRNNDDASLPWTVSTPNGFFTGIHFDAVSIVQSNLGDLPGGWGDPGDLDGVGRIGTDLYHFWRDTNGWHLDASPFATGVSGTPSIIQGQYGFHGNFEVVTPMTSGGLAHWFRNNDAPGVFPWILNANQGDTFGLGLWNNSQFSDCTLIQGGPSVGPPMPFALLARLGTDLLHFKSSLLGAFVEWTTPPDVLWGPHRAAGSGVDGPSSLIQGHFGTVGNYEAVCPSIDNGILHMWRNNDSVPFVWDIQSYLTDLGHVDAATVIQSNFGNPGNLEGIIRTGSNLWHYWRDNAGWHHGSQPFFPGAQA
jgi:hypothetical protein